MSDQIRPARYQLVALTKIFSNGFHALLVADGVGVGKTISAAYILLYLTILSGKAGLVVCPPTLVTKWIQELKSKFGITVLPVRSREDLLTARREGSTAYPESVPVYVMPSSLTQRTKIREYPSFSVVVLDEIHNYRNKATKSFEQISQIARLGDYRVGLSATPINNSLDDLVSELKILLPDYAWETIQAAMEEIWRTDKKLTEPLLTRFTKDKLRIHFAKRRIESRSVSYEPDYMAKVQTAISGLHLKKGSRSSLYEDITYFRLAASSPYAFSKSMKLPSQDGAVDIKLETFRAILSSEELDQWLVFCGFQDTVEYLAERADDWECYVLTGNTPMFDRPSIIESFKRSDRSLLIMTEVGSEGLDLQFCNGIINYDLHWNPMRLEQRLGRVDRIGQAKDEVVAYNMIVAGSIDDRMIRVVRRKLKLLEGSVFSPGTLFGALRSSGGVAAPMFSNEVLAHELEESNALFGALKYVTKLSTDDYVLLPDISDDYCMPGKLADVARREPAKCLWVRQNQNTIHWSQRLKDTSNKLVTLLEYYS